MDGAGSKLTGDAELQVGGKDGTGIVNLANGGTVSNSGMNRIGSELGATGTITVGGTVSTLTSGGNVFIGG